MRSVALLAAVYFVVWWLVLFTVLPWGVHSQHETGEISPGSDPGAPTRPLLLRKAIVTTLIATVVVGLGYAAWAYGLVSERVIPPGLFPPPPGR
ncbi:MAG TPA: DUF1467 family protein [Xanthobacteraceae bacterium]|nr:DUF1467 family protein [Xanthobacteraceae bacterium]